MGMKETNKQNERKRGRESMNFEEKKKIFIFILKREKKSQKIENKIIFNYNILIK